MNRLEERHTIGIDISRCCHPQTALQRRSEVRNNIAEHIVRHHDLKILRLTNDHQRQRIYIKVVCLYPWIARRNFLERPLPQVSGKSHHIRLVAHAHLRLAVPPCILEGVFDDPLHALSRVNFNLRSNLVRRSLLEHAAGVHIGAFRVLANHSEVHVSGRDTLQRAKFFMKQLYWPDVGIQVQAEAHGKENLRGMLVVGNSRITDGAKQNRVEILPKHFQRAFGKCDTLAQISVRSPVEFDELQFFSEQFVNAFENFEGLACDIDTDAVTGNDRNALQEPGPVSVWYSARSARRCDSSSFAKSMKIFLPLASEICSAKSLKNW